MTTRKRGEDEKTTDHSGDKERRKGERRHGEGRRRTMHGDFHFSRRLRDHCYDRRESDRRAQPSVPARKFEVSAEEASIGASVVGCNTTQQPISNRLPNPNGGTGDREIDASNTRPSIGAVPASGTEPCCTGSPNCLHAASVPLDTPPAARSITAKWDDIPVSHEQARQAILALVDEHFRNNKRRTQFSIPVRSDDTDTLLMRYVKQQEATAPPSPPSDGREFISDSPRNSAASTKLFLKLVAVAHSLGISTWEAQERMTIDALREIARAAAPPDPVPAGALPDEVLDAIGGLIATYETSDHADDPCGCCAICVAEAVLKKYELAATGTAERHRRRNNNAKTS